MPDPFMAGKVILRPSESRRILIVARRDSREVDGVIDDLRARGFIIVRWNLCQFPEHETVTIRGGVGLPFSDFLHSDFAAAWLHDASGLSVVKSLEGLPREVSISESSAFWEGALLQLSTNWLNDPISIRRASSKILQLITAERIGLRVPPFAVTNDPNVVNEFLREYGALAIKNLSTGYVEHPTKCLKFYTRRMTEMFTGFQESLHYGPIIAQQAIAKKCEFRITVIDGKSFSVNIDCTGLGDSFTDIRKLDFRKERWRFRSERSSKLETESCRITEALGLSYAGIDWIVDERGQEYFLECNPLGSFKWYEMVAGESITKAIADALSQRCVLA